MEKISYKELIDGINNGTLNDVHFKLTTYNHYRSCHLRRKYVYIEILDKWSFDCIELSLCDDGSEVSYYHGTFKDKEKLFHIKGKGSFTLKEVYKDIEIISIEYKK